MKHTRTLPLLLACLVLPFTANAAITVVATGESSETDTDLNDGNGPVDTPGDLATYSSGLFAEFYTADTGAFTLSENGAVVVLVTGNKDGDGSSTVYLHDENGAISLTSTTPELYAETGNNDSVSIFLMKDLPAGPYNISWTWSTDDRGTFKVAYMALDVGSGESIAVANSASSAVQAGEGPLVLSYTGLPADGVLVEVLSAQDASTAPAAGEVLTNGGDKRIAQYWTGISGDLDNSYDVGASEAAAAGVYLTTGGGGEPTTWLGFPIMEGGYVDTGAWMGMINVMYDPWIYSYSLQDYVYFPIDQDTVAGGWAYVLP